MVLADVAFVSAEIVYYDKKTDYSNCCKQDSNFSPKGTGSCGFRARADSGYVDDYFLGALRRNRLVGRQHAKYLWYALFATEWESILSRRRKLLWSL